MRVRGKRARVRRRVRHATNEESFVLRRGISVPFVVRQKEMQLVPEKLARPGSVGAEPEEADEKGQRDAGQSGEEMLEKVEIDERCEEFKGNRLQEQ